MNSFEQKLAAHHLRLTRAPLQVLQINVGRKCNQACRHCHVDAAPWRTEMMDEPTARRIAAWIQQHHPPVVDITGGAPELSEFFRYFVETARAAGSHVIDRNNLTILEEPGYADLPEYLAQHEVEVVASLPCYLPDNVTKQRGAGVYEKSIRALQRFNALGYGTRLPLNLVYNPVGATLPPPQAELEADYREALQRDHGIVFNRLYTITNQPIARFAEDLRRQGKWDEYLELLVSNFNPATVDGLMCRNTLSVDYLGRLYDCDFNQMLDMVWRNGRELYLWDVHPNDLPGRTIATGLHCFACTAGCGSSCTGALQNQTASHN
jgi:radical SAM/Cys-rich protein